MRKLFASLCATLVLAGGVASTAGAQQRADGLVVVQIGDITVQDVNIGVAAQIVATACDLVDIGAVAVLVERVDLRSRQETFCRTEAGKVKVTQN